ncbi:MAG: apolipoprotein N-acyltransferase [Woeseia sp.]|nr:apolipoprotein N-acyltransferase [Woeseia sp.]
MPLPGRQLAQRFIFSRPYVARLALAACGGAMTLCFAPFNLWFAAPFLLLPLLLVCLHCTPRESAWLGFSYGVGMFLFGTYWITISIHVFGKAPLVLAVILMVGLILIMAMWLAACGWLLATFSRGDARRLLFVAPAAWVLIEWLRGFVLSGFPWLSLGYSQIEAPLSGWLPLGGVYGVSLLVAFSSASLVLALQPAWRWRALALAVLPWVIGLGLRDVEWTEPAGPALRATVVQGGVSQDRKWLPEQFRSTLDLYRGALRAARNSDIVIWPEVAIPALDTQVEPYLALLQRDLQPDQTLLLGILEQDAERIYNSVLKLDRTGRGTYRKRHLVPFGEYFPVPDFVREWMRMLSLPHSDLVAGSAVQPLLNTVGGQQLAVAICYEDAYGSEQLYAFPEATLIVNVSNDAWFGDSIAPHQHLQIARVRAREVERNALRATNNGISAIIGADGALLAVARQFEFATLTLDVEPRRGSTPYSLTGNWLVVNVTLLLLAIAYWTRRSPGGA